MQLTIKNTVLLVLMLAAGAMATVLRPSIRLADERPPIDLAAKVPTQFAGWQEQFNLTGC